MDCRQLSAGLVAVLLSACSGDSTGPTPLSAPVATVPVASVSVTSPQTTLTVGGATQVMATLKAADGTPLTDRAVAWNSSNTAGAIVSSTGLVTATGPGTTTITATSEGVSGGITLTILPLVVASVSISPSAASMTPGQVIILTATVRDAGGNVLGNQVVNWSSSNLAVATVIQNGQVTAVGVGTATIRAASGGQTGLASVTVTNVP